MAVGKQEETGSTELETDGGDDEDEEEAEIGAEGADEVDEGEHSHGERVECCETWLAKNLTIEEVRVHTETGLKSGSDTERWSTLTSWREETKCVEHWDESCRLGQEVSSVTEEDQHGEGVAKEEFADTSKEEQDAAEPYTGSGGCNTETAGTTPVHCVMLANVTSHPTWW